jgi:alpha-tubulin suppressor-like RCC1 family protein
MGVKGIWKLQDVRDLALKGDWTYCTGTAPPGPAPSNDFLLFYSGPGATAGGVSGQNTGIAYSSPVQIAGNWLHVDSHREHTLAVKTDNTLWTIGQNDEGQGGFNSSTPARVSSPVQIPGSTWCYSATGYSQGLALRTNNTLWIWGRQGNGRTAQNQCLTGNASSPVQIPGTTWCKAKFGNDHGLAIRTDNTLWAWGQNDSGSLGLNTASCNTVSSPTQIPGSWSIVCAGYNTSMGLKTDGTLWTWGVNDAGGQLGDNTIISKSSPVQVPGATWCAISMNNRNGAAIKTNNTLFIWGNNENGQLGDNTIISKSSPVQIPGTTWCHVDVGYSITAATKTDGTMWVWGDNSAGGLGLNNQISSSSPVQLTGSWICSEHGEGNWAYYLKNA